MVAMRRKKIHSIQDFSQYFTSNEKICQSMGVSAPALYFAEKNIFQVGRVGSETRIERLFTVNMQRRAAGDEAIGNDAVFLFVRGKFGFFNGALPDFAGKLRDGDIRAALIQQLAFVND